MQKNIRLYVSVCATICCLINFTGVHAQRSGFAANGDYTLSAITLEDNSMQDALQGVPVFEDASINCLLNSQWLFSKGEGYYKINSANACAKGMRQIDWKFFNLKGTNFFQFVRTSAVHGIRADVHDIYICEVKSSEKETFILRYPILFADKPNAILFTFTHQ